MHIPWFQVAFIDAVRAKRYHGQIPPHDIKFSTDSNARALGTQVLMDILLLARCEHFLHAESSVALLASYFNPNMRSYFLDPDKTFLKVNSPNKDNDQLFIFSELDNVVWSHQNLLAKIYG